MLNRCLLVVALLLCVSICTTHSLGQDAAPDQTDPTIAPEVLRNLMGESTRQGGSQTPRGIIEIEPGKDKDIARARFVSVPLSLAADALGQVTGENVVVSHSVADQLLTLTLRDLDLPAALDAIAVAQGLVSRRDDDSKLYVLATPAEVRQDLAAFRNTKTEVFTLLYPNAGDVVRAIGDVFGDRVVVNEPDTNDNEELEELEQRFERFDVIEQRSRGLTSVIGGTNISTSSGSSLSNSRRNDSDSVQSRIARPRDFEREDLDLTAEEARALVQARAGEEDARAFAAEIARYNATTFVTSIPRLNRVIVRSSDPTMLEDIASLIERLDVPTPLVLLEVRVLRVDLNDGLDTSFDFAFESGDFTGFFSDTGANLSAGVFQLVSDNFTARLQVLQSKGRVTSLATPLILTANNEVSRIFSGEQIPIVIGFTEPQVIVSDGGDISIPAAPVTELRDVGTDLLITANINADRTVTIRLLQETSSVNQDGASLLVPSGASFTTETVDTVISQSASGTVVAQDGMMLAFGGLIEETETDAREQLPVLGDIPLIGFLFRRDVSTISRNELIVMIRPYVLSTPVEGDMISRNLLKSLSIHPYEPGEGAQTGEPDEWGVFRDNQPAFDRSIFDLFRYHTAPSFRGGGS